MSTLVERLSKVQSELKAPKGQYNSFGKYSYRSCEDILEAVKPLLDGLVLTVSDDVMVVGMGDEKEPRVYVKAVASVTDGKETIVNTAFAREPETKKGMDPSQITGTASSYARKYALNGLFLIDDTKDADTDEHKKQTSGKAESKAPPKKLEVSQEKKPFKKTGGFRKSKAKAANDDI